MGQLVVVRHGQASLFAADYDELSPRGVAQANALGQYLARVGARFDFAFVGPAKRQRDTAAHVAAAFGDTPWRETIALPELDEHDAFAMISATLARTPDDAEFAPLAHAIGRGGDAAARSGAFQRLFEAVMRRWLRGELAFDHIETWPVFEARVARGLQAMRSRDGAGVRMIAFTSVGPIAVLMQRALATDDLRSFETAWRIRNSSLTTFVLREHEFTLDGFNALPHLPDPREWTFR
jgi:broad specificity phosphatase PhoE